jgi:hypothetical protein
MGFDMKQLTEGITQHDERAARARLVKKWDKTGLLNGLKDSPKHQARTNMARLLESQAAQMLTEASSTGDLAGFQNVAFPIVRRVFGGLIANELVSVQPMSLPSGLIFYLDYRFDTVKAGNRAKDFAAGGSLFGDQTAPGVENLATNGLYNLGTSFSQREKVSIATFSGTLSTPTLQDINWDPEISGSIGAGTLQKLVLSQAYTQLSAAVSGADSSTSGLKQWVPVSGSSTSNSSTTDGTPVRIGGLTVLRRHTRRTGSTDLQFIVDNTDGAAVGVESIKVSYIVASSLRGGTSGTLVLPEWESDMGSPPVPVIPEIDFRLQSVAVTANTRKLKARWTPELAQDLAAYQNLDAEVELTQVLSEAIALEIDREILGDLLYNATGANYYWSRKPGNFVDKTTGNTASGASFTGTVREWYETLIETIIDVANTIHRKTLRGAANWIVTSPDVSTILEASVLYKPNLSMDPKETMFSVGTEKMGSLNNRFTVYKDPYFPRNRILVGYKGGSFLETGFVYAPYVPLIVTPTIYAPEDFTPRKGVMTRYATQLVRSDFYGTVTVQDMNVI